MRRQVTTALALLALTAGVATAVEPDPGATIRAHDLATLDGETMRLDAFAGEVLVVNFWASWCAPCREELPLLDDWNDRWRGRGARVVAVSIDVERANARQLARQLDLDLTTLHDGPDGLAVELDLAAVPSTYLLDRAGRVALVIHGSAPEDLERLHRAVESLLSGQKGSRS